jgi:hypothetical protein
MAASANETAAPSSIDREGAAFANRPIMRRLQVSGLLNIGERDKRVCRPRRRRRV